MRKFTHLLSVVVALCMMADTAIAQPTVTSFTPATAAPGSNITINGTNFNTTAANNVVFFGPVRGTVTAATETQLTVTVPTGATFGPLTVINTATNLQSRSLLQFTPQFTPAKSTFTGRDFEFGTTLSVSNWGTRIGVPVDIDGDGLPELAFAGTGQSNAFVYPNISTSATIGFGTPITTGLQFSISAAAGDLDGDGKQDVGFIANNSSNIRILRNTSTGVGNFSLTETSQLYSANIANAQAMVFSDLTGDGKLDIAAVSFGGTISTLTNTSTVGSINFNLSVNRVTGIADGPISINAGDVDGDGKSDLIVGKLSTGTFSIFRNTSSGGNISFATEIPLTIAGSGSNLLAGVALADINTDGKLDIVAGFSTANAFSVYQNNSSSGSIDLATPITFNCNSIGSLGISDFNGDGKPDVAIFTSGSNTIQLFGNTFTNGSIDASSFATGVQLAALSGTSAINPTFADINGDGRVDIITADIGSNSATVLANNPAYTWYSKASGAAALQSASNWGFNTDGTGVAPSNFLNSNHTFQLANEAGNNYGTTADWNVAGTLQIPAAAKLSLGGAFTIGSSVVNNGNITITPSGGLVGNYTNVTGSGTITAQQNFVGQRGWRVLANPFSSSVNIANTASSNTLSISTTPGVGGTTDSRLFNNATNAWSNISSATWAANTPYALFYRGTTAEVTGLNYTAGPAGQVFSVTGSINGGSVDITPSSSSNFMIVGNPFYAPVTTQALTGRVASPYYVYQITQGADLAARRARSGSWILAAGNSSPTTTIPMLGTLAYIPTNTNTFSVTTADISTAGTVQGSMFRSQLQPFAQLGIDVLQRGTLLDRLYIRQDAVRTGVVPKFQNDVCNFYINEPAGVRVASVSKAKLDTIALGIQSTQGVYSIAVSEQSLPSNVKATLIDKFTNRTHALIPGAEYGFEITAAAASQGNDRFLVVVTEDALVRPTLPAASSLQVTLQSSNVGTSNCVIKVNGAANNTASIVVRNINGIAFNTRTVGNGVHHISLPATAGMYFIEVADGTDKAVIKVIQ